MAGDEVDVAAEGFFEKVEVEAPARVVNVDPPGGIEVEGQVEDMPVLGLRLEPVAAQEQVEELPLLPAAARWWRKWVKK